MQNRALIFGVFWVLVSCVAWYYVGGDLFAQIGLSMNHRCAPGVIIDGDEELGENHVWTSRVVYRYKIPDGRSITSSSVLDGRLPGLPFPVEVEFFPARPEISRIKGTSREEFFNLALLLFVATIPACYGYLTLRDEFRKRRSNPKGPEPDGL